MAVTIKVRRGTKAELDGITLSLAELGYTTDTDEVYVGDGSAHHLIGKVYIDTFANRPSAGVNGRLFQASDTGKVYVDDGTSWDEVGVGLINDSATNSTETWSSTKIQSELDSLVSGINWQDPCDDVVADANTTAPGVGLPAASTGQRYILETNTSTLHANWSTITGVGDNDIVEYNGTSWEVAFDVSVEGEGALSWIKDVDKFYRWNGTAWAEFGGLSEVTGGWGLRKNGNTMHVDLADVAGTGLEQTGTAEVDETLRISTAAAGNGLTGGGGSALAVQAESAKGVAVGASGVSVALDSTERTAAGTNDANNNPIYRDTNGLNIKIDSSSIELDSANGYRMYVALVDGGTFV
jgi:hypothetical protein